MIGQLVLFVLSPSFWWLLIVKSNYLKPQPSQGVCEWCNCIGPLSAVEHKSKRTCAVTVKKKSMWLFQPGCAPHPKQVYVTDYFNVKADQGLTALCTHFTQLQESDMFGFFLIWLNCVKLKILIYCSLCVTLSMTETQDISTQDLFHELRIVRNIAAKWST